MTKLDSLCDILKDAPDEIFIQPHNVPDPDAIASSFGLRYLLKTRGIKTEIVYDQEMEKANSLQMLDVFNISMTLAHKVATLGEEDWVILVDGQKGNSNLTDLPTEEVAVIDHHEYRGPQDYKFEDVRPNVGSCSAIIAQYFFENEITPPMPEATALMYGILIDTNNLSRGVSELDLEMLYKLYAHADMPLINRLKGSEISLNDLYIYADAFKTVELFQRIGFLRIDRANDSLMGAAADIVLSTEEIDVVVAYTQKPEGIKLSIRSEVSNVNAAELVQHLVENLGVGGGHPHMAGGFIPSKALTETTDYESVLRSRVKGFIASTINAD